MSFLHKKVLGAPSGKTGDLVFKSLNNQTVIATAPESYSTPMDTASVTRRTKFRLVVKLSAAIIKLISIKLLWKKAAASGKSAFSEVVKETYKHVNDAASFTAAVLTKDAGFVLSGPEVVVSASSVVLSGDPLGTGTLDITVEKKISAEGVLCLSSPTDPADEPYVMIPLSSADQDVSLTAPLSFTMDFLSTDTLRAARYSTKKAVVTLVTKDSDGLPVRASVTVAG
jgi:hypothetical protein